MPIVLDYAANGAIIGGSFFSHVQHGAVEGGVWQVVLSGAIYARLVHSIDDGTLVQGFLRDLGNGRLGVAGSGEQQQVSRDDLGNGRLGMTGNGEQQQVSGDEDVVMGQQASPAVMQDGSGEISHFSGSEDFAMAQQAPSAIVRIAIEEDSSSSLSSIADEDSVLLSLSPPPRYPKRKRVSVDSVLEVTLPIAIHVEETTGAVSVANTANYDKRTTPRATQIPHVGTIFTHYRALLLRTDNPYLCILCGTGFPHPTDVKAHFTGHPSIEGRGCWAKHGSPADALWNDHASCKISEADLNFTRSKEGLVIVDKASWDKINAAADAGRSAKGDEGVDGVATVSKVLRDLAPRSKKAKVAAKEMLVPEPVERRVLPRRKSAKARDQIDAEMEAAGGAKAMSSAKETPKRKVVRAGDETETDVSARKR